MSRRDTAVALGLAAVVGVLTIVGLHKWGSAGGLAVPLVAVVLVVLMRWPLVMLGLTLGLVLLCEGSSVDVPLMHELYRNLYGGIEPVDLLVTLTFFSAAADLVRRGRRPRLPAVPAFAMTLMVVACIDGVLVGHGAGVSLKQALLSLNPIVEIVAMTFVVFSLDLSDEQIVTLLRWLLAMAVIKAVMGFVVMALGLSADVENGTTITYYEPTANWLGLMSVLGLLAVGLGDSGRVRATLRHGLGESRARLLRGRWAPSIADARGARRERRALGPDLLASARARAESSAGPLWRRLRSRWGLLVFGLAFACLLLSYRRSFWIGGALALVVLIPLAATPRKRLMIVPVALLLGGAIWTLQTVDHQAVEPIVSRATSLTPTALAANPEDRYRLDERANVIAEIKTEPLTGIGVQVPWVATVRQMGIEHPEGRLYVDFGLLYWWLKMGVLGAAAYLGFLVAMAILAFQTWRRHRVRELRCFGLAALCSVFALAAIETTAAFTGVDPRFSVLIGAQFGLLAALAGRHRDSPAADRRQAANGASGDSWDPRPQMIRAVHADGARRE